MPTPARATVLELIGCRDLDCITVHSATIEDLLVIAERLRRVHIVAPVLKKFTMSGKVPLGSRMSFLAPAVEIFSWNCRFTRCFGPPEVQLPDFGMWYLNDLKLGTEERGFVLSLDLGRPVRFHSFEILILFYVILLWSASFDM
jgi:hypothetical protein